MTLEHHPDKGGDQDRFQQLSNSRESLSSNLQFALRDLFRNGLGRNEAINPRYTVQSASVRISSGSDGWPRMRLAAQIQGAQGETLTGGAWALGIEAVGVFMIGYEGNPTLTLTLTLLGGGGCLCN